MNSKRPISFLSVLAIGGGLMSLALLSSLLRAIPAASKPTTKSAATKTAQLPATTMKAPQGKEIATFAAGCFWSMEAIFEKLKGVESVEPGYAGGHVAKPSYERVSEGKTGHAEAVNIIFDPKVISYRDLLQVLLIVRDPTTLNRQGPDEGPSYRSVIFTHSDAQEKAAKEAIRDITASKVWKAPIVTPVTNFANFYQAEDYHRDYYTRNPQLGYCTGVIAPKLEQLKKKFPDKVKP
jgi:peptide-methionine (S)-S-oxide reductase